MLEFNTPFSLTDVVFPIEIMWRYPWECFLSKFHIFMLARSLFNEHNKSSNLLGIVAWSALGKQNRQAKKVYLCGQFGDRDKRNQTCPQNRAYHVVKRKAAESDKMKNAREIKACKTCAFHANLWKFLRLLSPSSSWLDDLPSYNESEWPCDQLNNRRGLVQPNVSNESRMRELRRITSLFHPRFASNLLFCVSWGVNAGLNVGKKNQTLYSMPLLKH